MRKDESLLASREIVSRLVLRRVVLAVHSRGLRGQFMSSSADETFASHRSSQATALAKSSIDLLGYCIIVCVFFSYSGHYPHITPSERRSWHNDPRALLHY